MSRCPWSSFIHSIDYVWSNNHGLHNSKSFLLTKLVLKCTIESLTWSRTCNLTKLAVLSKRFSTSLPNNLPVYLWVAHIYNLVTYRTHLHVCCIWTSVFIVWNDISAIWDGVFDIWNGVFDIWNGVFCILDSYLVFGMMYLVLGMVFPVFRMMHFILLR